MIVVFCKELAHVITSRSFLFDRLLSPVETLLPASMATDLRDKTLEALSSIFASHLRVAVEKSEAPDVEQMVCDCGRDFCFVYE